MVMLLYKLVKAVYTPYVAPRRPKSESVTYILTDRRTDGRTHALIESLCRDLKRILQILNELDSEEEKGTR